MAKRIVNIFTVLKNDDIRKYLSKEQRCQLLRIVSTIQSGRIVDGKKPGNNYHVCNSDEPYAGKILEIILQGEYEKEIALKESE